MTKDLWEDFRTFVNNEMLDKFDNKSIDDTTMLDKYWNLWSNIIKQAANKFIPFLILQINNFTQSL